MNNCAIGICIGAANIKVVVLSQTSTGVIVSHTYSRRHNSNPKKALADIMHTYQAPYGILTGRKFCAMIKAPSIPEPEALENGLAFLRKQGDTKIYPAILSMGAENFIVYRLNKNDTIASIETGNKCASGTGEFFMQQIGRMDTPMAEAIEQAHHTHPYKVSGRCSVFCKSDCTHALNNGIPIGRVTAGLCEMIADKALDLLQKTGTQDLLAVGGVTNNTVIIEHLRKHTHNLTVASNADVFEALGAAYYALINKIPWEIDKDYIETNTSFSFLPPIIQGIHLVGFETTTRTKAQAGDECILGLDAGSTTTKAVLIRLRDSAIVASAYLRTNGNPIKATRECYQELQKQIHHKISIVGLGTTGSGRQITGLHAQTDGIINEIIAHATGATFFNKDVDTIFEIGGQDAKYTHLVNGVPADYAMNEACSAGTGSFIEETVRENMGLFFTDIEAAALAGKKPPNFNDQCAAFISSDIKTAIHEGITQENIVAGLVYSICMNYVNRVKGSRSIGKKIFMQGGVCYNKAIPIAMANLIQREIIVPPEPGLIGAFGVALEIKNRIETNHYDKRLFDLTELINREITYGRSFVCQGNSLCDRKCEISNMIVDGQKLPFGGACNKYYNFVHHVFKDTSSHDYVQKRQNLHFHTFEAPLCGKGISVGIPRSFLANMLYPFYSYFFSILGCKVVLSDVDPEGLKKTRSSFCYPAEIAHGCYSDLLNKQVDYIFLPKTTELYVDNSVSRRQEHQCTCMILQNEPYYLKSAFKSTPSIISPVIDYSQGWETMTPIFEKIATDIGRPLGRAAFYIALKKQKEYTAQLKTTGRELLELLQDDPQARAIVLFGRPYNAFAKETNMGIPTKFASRGEYIIPWDMLPFEDEYCDPDMNWAIGQNLMKTAQFTAKHPQLFGAWVTNFSCGPDSFLVGYFRDIMGTKPSLTLELDSHTADAGINTRIEAFLDIITKYTQPIEDEPSLFKATKIEGRTITDGNGVTYDLFDPIVHWLIPSMGESSVLLAAALAGSGIRSISVEDNDNETLHLGHQNSSGKECLPLQLVTGSLLKYLKHNQGEAEILVYFMPTCGGNCRFSQYNVFLRNLIEKKQIRDVAILSLTNENGYAGLSPADTLNVLKALYIGDVMDDIKNTLAVIASDPKGALAIFEEEYLNIAAAFQNKDDIYRTLQITANRFRTIPLKYPRTEARVIALMGEVFVRRDMFACRSVIEMLRKHDIIAHRAHLTEWLAYCDYNVTNKIYDPQFSWMGKLQFKVKKFLDKRMERKIKTILASSGLYTMELIDIDKIIATGKHFFDPRSTGEAILVAGSFFNSVPNHYLGAISIGPFACMPSRVIESILSVEATGQTKEIITGADCGIDQLPFLAIETDGNPLPQILEARIEAFCLQVKRIKPWTATT